MMKLTKSLLCLLPLELLLLLVHVTHAEDGWKDSPVIVTNEEYVTGVALDGDTMAVGSWIDKAVFIHVFNNVTGEWEQQAKLTGTGNYTKGLFGGSVAISGKAVIIGDYWDTPDNGITQSGSVYIFEDDTGDGDWNQKAKFFLEQPGEDDYFGYAVDIDDDMAVAGAFLRDTTGCCGAGEVHVIQKNGVSGEWERITILTPDDHQGADFFGYSVAIQKPRIVIGAEGQDTPPIYGHGSAYVFSTETFDQEAQIVPQNLNSTNYFGSSVAIDDNLIVVGADANSNNQLVGSAFLFELDLGQQKWVQTAKLVTSDGRPEDRIGSDVGLSDGFVIVASGDSYAEAAYVYFVDNIPSSGILMESAKLVPDEDSNFFGSQVDADGIRIAIKGTYKTIWIYDVKPGHTTPSTTTESPTESPTDHRHTTPATTSKPKTASPTAPSTTVSPTGATTVATTIASTTVAPDECKSECKIFFGLVSGFQMHTTNRLGSKRVSRCIRRSAVSLRKRLGWECGI